MKKIFDVCVEFLYYDGVFGLRRGSFLENINWYVVDFWKLFECCFKVRVVGVMKLVFVYICKNIWVCFLLLFVIEYFL